MKKDDTEKKATAGCFIVMALFFLVLGIFQCSEDQHSKQDVTPFIIEPSMNTAPASPKTKTTVSTFTPEDDEETDGDPYDNPDFDDLIPGEEYDEEFVDRDEGDPELYDGP